MAHKVCILDYGSGNVKSVFNVFSTLTETVVSNDAEEIKNASHIVLPGVGSFGKAMEKIKKMIPVEMLLDEVLQKRKPFLGICVGMQVMLSKGYEFGEWEGLGLIRGKVEIIETNLTLPHVGWNDVQVLRDNSITKGLPSNPDFYFVHSYKAELEDKEEVLAETLYGSNIAAVVTAKGTNAFGVQFHPEKSQQAGVKILNNFLSVTQ